VDYFFSDAAEPAERYVFGGLASEGFDPTILNDSKHRIALSDLWISGGVTTVAGVNDLVADVTVTTTVSMVDDLTISIISGKLELDSLASGAIGGFEELKDDLPVSTIPVPEPASAMLFALGVVLLKRRSRRVE